MSRESEAMAYHEACKERMKTRPQPKGQKFDVGSRVRISDELGKMMCHFRSGEEATVMYVYAHMYGGSDIESYSLQFDDGGTSAWYWESQLTQVEAI